MHIPSLEMLCLFSPEPLSDTKDITSTLSGGNARDLSLRNVGGQYWCEKTVKKILELIFDTIVRLYTENPNLVFKLKLQNHFLTLK